MAAMWAVISFVVLALIAGVIRYIGQKMAKKADEKYFGGDDEPK